MTTTSASDRTFYSHINSNPVYRFYKLACGPVWPKVLIMSSFIGGLCYGNIRQQGFYSNARNILEKERKAIDMVKEDILEAEAIELAKSRGEDLSLYHIPRGLRQLALSFKKTLSKNADDDDDDDDNVGANILK